MRLILPAVIFALSLHLTACSDDDDDKKGTGKGNEATAQGKNITDYSMCNRGTPGITVETFTWVLNQEIVLDNGEKMETRQFLSFEQGNATLGITCIGGGTQVTAIVGSPVQVTADKIVVEEESADTQEIKVGQDTYACQTSFNKASIPYQFKGSCLLINLPDGPALLAPK